MNPAALSMLKSLLGIDPTQLQNDMSAFVNGVSSAINEIRERQTRIEEKLDLILSHTVKEPVE